MCWRRDHRNGAQWELSSLRRSRGGGGPRPIGISAAALPGPAVPQRPAVLVLECGASTTMPVARRRWSVRLRWYHAVTKSVDNPLLRREIRAPLWSRNPVDTIVHPLIHHNGGIAGSGTKTTNQTFVGGIFRGAAKSGCLRPGFIACTEERIR